MGQKVTVDSATMLNKGLELFEAFWLFGVEPEKLDVLVHPSVNVHAALLFKDGSAISQNAVGNMLVPIAAALSYPGMLDVAEKFPEMNFEFTGKTMTFLPPDLVKYPLLKTAFELLRNRDFSGMVAYAISDETAVEKFLKGKIKVKGIHRAVEAATAKFSGLKPPSSVEQISDFIDEIEKFTEEVL
jgi:1-deoxy-D-xylulose-5-phosphate reductoisomerase